MRRMILAVPLLLAACDSKGEPPATPAAVDRVRDPICGMMVERTAPFKATYEGADYRFCADDCLKKFQAEPAKYAVPCACGKTSKKCPCGHCGTKGDTCDCG